MPNFNANTTVLIPKIPSADSVDHYRPIALANLKFKIISKILADRLAQIMPTIISKEQRGFIHGRQIKDCICLASEAVNLLYNKSFGDNLAMKIDISKAFDTLDGGSSEQRHLEVGGGWQGGSHQRNKIINVNKSTIYSGAIPLARLNIIANFLGFNIGILPFIYLGVPIFKGKPKSCHFQPIADKVKAKLSAWKASLLSIAGRVQLVQSVVYGMLNHTMSIYSWPVNLIKTVEVENSVWLIGKGEKVNFWNDDWCGRPLVHLLQIPLHLHSSLNAPISDFIFNYQWNLPIDLELAFPNLRQIVQKVTILIEDKMDKLLWKESTSGELSLKDAFLFKAPVGNNLGWAKSIWSKDIPHSKSLFVWRLMHDKIATDDKMTEKGFNLPSMCTLCSSYAESIPHLNWTPQCSIVIKSAMINILNAICSLTGNRTKLVYRSSMQDFMILKAFKVHLHPPKAPTIKDIIWQPPTHFWVKCNSDGAALGAPGLASCGGLFRNSSAEFLGAFAENLGVNNALYAELVGAMKAIEIAFSRQWYNLWLESDSQEGNHCADILASIGLTIVNSIWWNDLPLEIREQFHRNKFGLPNYRFSSF
ncbi:ribonuclease H [Trifolium pratense]|uniref:Ribonuclease H n=1 Tax=Trifolium pratense TaxID=57577 RepID=A0A2K3PQZ1_TRIPR|nr:ribonuclease H [Trifolium pratense]